MIIHDGTQQFLNYQKLQEFGLSKEYFESLPHECQQAILMAGIEAEENRKMERDNFQKRIALRQYEFEEKVKKKILTFLKKK